MPSSVLDQIPDVVNAVHAYQPRSILDIGVGCGKYALLLREYIEGCVRPPAAILDPATRQLRVDGVEVFPEYLTEVHRRLYDRILVGDITQIAASLEEYDVIMLIDVIEHIEKSSAIQTLDSLFAKARRGLVLATPTRLVPQGKVFGNPHETHLDSWSPSDFARWPHVQVATCADQLLVCLSKDPALNKWMTVLAKKQGLLGPLRQLWWRWSARRSQGA